MNFTWTVPSLKYKKPVILRPWGDQPPKLVGLYARGISQEGEYLEPHFVPLERHDVAIFGARWEEQNSRYPVIASAELVKGHKILLSEDRMIKSGLISISDFDEVPNPRFNSDYPESKVEAGSADKIFPSIEDLMQLDLQAFDLCKFAVGLHPELRTSAAFELDLSDLRLSLRRLSGVRFGPS